MKQFLLFMTLCLIPVMSFAQEKDSDGRVVTQNGTQYKVTFNATSDNGGTISETWYGSIVNGKREGTWNFVGNYNKDEISSGIFRTGTVTMTRTYKNGVPNGKYVLKHDLQLMNGGYNIFTDNWIYKAPSDYNEYISGAYINGEPTGTWNINYEGLEKLTVTFKNGVMDGVFSITDVIRGLTTKGSFKNGYVFQMKEMGGTDWGYETDYAGKDPATIMPQETISLKNLITRWELYTTGMNICNEYMTDYPAGSSDDDAPETNYIFSDPDTYRKLFGNVPKDVLASLEHRRQTEINDRLDLRFHEIDFQVDSLYRNHSDTLSEDFKDFLSKFKLEYLYKTEYVNKSIFAEHPEFITFIEDVQNSTNNTLQYTLKDWYCYNVSDNFTTRFDQLYTEALDEVREHHGSEQDLDSTLFVKIYPNKQSEWSDRSAWNEFLQSLDRKNVEETFQLTESDLLHYLAYKYGTYTLVYSGISHSANCKLKSRKSDASMVTKEEVKDFALKYTDDSGERVYYKCSMSSDDDRRYNINVTVVHMLNALKDTRAFQKLRETVTFEL